MKLMRPDGAVLLREGAHEARVGAFALRRATDFSVVSLGQDDDAQLA